MARYKANCLFNIETCFIGLIVVVWDYLELKRRLTLGYYILAIDSDVDGEIDSLADGEIDSQKEAQSHCHATQSLLR